MKEFICSKEHRLYDTSEMEIIKTGVLQDNEWYIYRVKEITFDEKAPRKEAFENVLGAMRVEGANTFYLILGDGKSVRFYLGVSKNIYKNINFLCRKRSFFT